MKKLESIAKKTGLDAKEINRFSKFSILGIIAILITTVMGCVKTNNVEKPISENMTLEEIKSLVKEVEAEKKSTGKKIKPDISDNCGPYPGYPCGTKYFTVAIEDFGYFA